jgi:hypothetical protein
MVTTAPVPDNVDYDDNHYTAKKKMMMATSAWCMDKSGQGSRRS